MEESLKIVVCYGDSNTWGFNPATQDRYPPKERWTGVLAEELAAPYRVIEEGLNGRTTVWDDPIEEWRNGKTYILPCLWSHKPIDLVTIMLGTNDLKERFSVSAYDIAAAAGTLVDITQRSAAGPNGNAPQVLLIAPPVVGKLTDYAEMFEDAVAKSKKFAEHYRRVAQTFRCHFLDSAPIITSSELDGIHLDSDQHRKLGLAVARRVREILD
jgi:lysophospholipase L1-like esterase